MREPGNTFRSSQPIRVTNTSRRFSEQIGGGDGIDLYRFDLVRRNRLNLTMAASGAPVEVSLLARRGGVLARSRSAKRNQTLLTNLNPGTYYIRVTASVRSDRVSYRLRLSTSAAAPILTTNAGASLGVGSTVTITGNVLKAVDQSRQPEQIVYTLTQPPKYGRLERDEDLLSFQERTGEGDRFTQADIDQGRLRYVSLPITPVTLPTRGNYSAVAIDGLNVLLSTGDGTKTDLDVAFYNGITKSMILLPNSDLYNDFAVGISGSNALWYRFDGTDFEVFVYDATLGKTTQLTNNNANDYAQAISETNVIWNTVPSATQIQAFFYNGATATTTQLINPVGQVAGFDFNTAIALSGTNVVWNGFDGTDFEVFLTDVSTGRMTQITDNALNDVAVAISGTNIVWNQFDGTDNEVFFYNGTTGKTIQLTNNDREDVAIGISGSNVIWNSGTESSAEVFFYNGTTGKIKQLTQNNVKDTAVAISGDNIIWNSGTNSAVFFYSDRTGTTTQLTATSGVKGAVGISGTRVVWNEDDAFASSQSVVLADVSLLLADRLSDRFGFTVSDGLGGVTQGTFSLTIGEG